MNARMSVPRVGPGLSANVDKEQMATLTGQKTSSFPHSPVLFSLHFYTAWHVWQGRLGFILECTIVYKTKKEQNRLLSCARSFFSWGYQTGYGSQATLACIKVKRHLEWPQNEQTCDPMSKNMHLTNINYVQKSSKDVFSCTYLFGGSIMDILL